MAEEDAESSAGGGGDTPRDDDSRADHGGRPCPMCGEPLYKRHCKYVCEQHGVVYDCSDPFN